MVCACVGQAQPQLEGLRRDVVCLARQDLVMNEPGGLDDLGVEGQAHWNSRLRGAIAAVGKRARDGSQFLDEPDRKTNLVTGIDWIGFPARIATCLGRPRALELLDWAGPRWDNGRYLAQEDYLEWRAIRDEDGRLCRVELTTELAAYWYSLAAYQPERTLELVAEFAGEASVAAEAVYGSDPFKLEPGEREAGFVQTMVPRDGLSPYNRDKAICFMVQPTNSLPALINLIAAATVPWVIEDEENGERRPLTAAELIPLTPHAAQQGRNSDPVLVERLNSLAFEGRQVAVDDPLGIYIQDVEHTRLRQPDGSPVPKEWFRFERGAGPDEAEDGRARYQCLTLEVPKSEGIIVGDLIDLATEEPIAYGGQVADLVQLAVFLRVSEPGQVRDDPQVVEPKAQPLPCQDAEAALQSFDEGRG
jgi:hypothetical protein